MLTHAFRKFFDTESRKAGMYPNFVELLMGHKLQGVRSHYFKPDPETLLEGTTECKGYIHAIDSLTINEENRLKVQNSELEKIVQDKEYIITRKLYEKEQELNQIKESMAAHREAMNVILEKFNEWESKGKQVTARKLIDKGFFQ